MIASMTAAYEEALRVLKLADRQDPITELIAKKTIDAAQIGETDPVRIRGLALRALPRRRREPARSKGKSGSNYLHNRKPAKGS